MLALCMYHPTHTAHQRAQEVSLDDSPDASPVSDGALEGGAAQVLPVTDWLSYEGRVGSIDAHVRAAAECSS